MENKEKKFNLAKKLHQSGKIAEAQEIYLDLIKENDDDKIYFLLGTSFLQLRQFEKAIDNLNRSIKINPKFPNSYNNRGIVFSEIKQFEKAIIDYDKVISLNPEFLEAHLNKAISLKNIRKFSDAIKCFEDCIQIDSSNPKVYLNLGNLLKEMKKLKEAEKAYDKAILLKDNFAEPYEGRGDVLQELSKIDKDNKKFKLSIKNYEKALYLNKNLNYVMGKIVHSKQIINDWENFDENLNIVLQDTLNNKKSIEPFPLLSLIDDPEIHLTNSRKFSKNIASDLNNNIHKKISENSIIKVGYFSADFNEHAVSNLIFKMLSKHNKNKFKIYCYAFGFENKDNFHKAIENVVDIYRDIRDISDYNAALLARKDGIDIAIDLQGYTDKHRVNIFSNRAAPIQVNFLGYPGSMGADFIDYIIADKNLIPENKNNFYSEKIIYLPHSYQPQNDEMKISDNIPSKKELDLPEDHFIFCAINNTYKITPQTFDVWMNVLKKVKRSILWLLEDNDTSKSNLIKEAKMRGINNKRLVFAKRTSHDKYLAQFKYADLYLDTFIYNAGATASNALWMGLPVLTMSGNSYSARMATSLLNSVGLGDLITNSIEDYQKLAIDLSSNIKKLNSIKEKLRKNISEKPLFDTDLYIKNFENGLNQIFDNYIKGNKPKDIIVEKNIY
tara:strand:- start:163 stop:2169 length:2007 start_codon:yes stop_codon:yes gene_type:complete